jgi:hypothetical protein
VRHLAASIAAVSVSVMACMPEQVGKSATSRALSTEGLITSTELFDVFIDTCLAHFPDGQATKAAFRRAGLKPMQSDPDDEDFFGDELGRFEDVGRRLVGGFGPIVYELSEDYDGGPLKLAECTVAAEIADPNANWAPLIASLNARLPSLNWTSINTLDASFNRDDARFEVVVEPQSPGHTWPNATPRCNEDDCGDWYEAQLSLGMIK